MYKCFTGSATDDLCELISSYTLAHRLRSFPSKTYGERSFCFIGPFLWNSLPTWMRTLPSVPSFNTPFILPKPQSLRFPLICFAVATLRCALVCFHTDRRISAFWRVQFKKRSEIERFPSMHGAVYKRLSLRIIRGTFHIDNRTVANCGFWLDTLPKHLSR